MANLNVTFKGGVLTMSFSQNHSNTFSSKQTIIQKNIDEAVGKKKVYEIILAGNEIGSAKVKHDFIDFVLRLMRRLQIGDITLKKCHLDPEAFPSFIQFTHANPELITSIAFTDLINSLPDVEEFGDILPTNIDWFNINNSKLKKKCDKRCQELNL